MDNQNLNILDEVNKGATMGMDAISYISDKVKDADFKNVLDFGRCMAPAAIETLLSHFKNIIL